MVKKQMGKGYKRRHQEQQRRESKRAYYGRGEGKKPMAYSPGEDMDEQEANYLAEQARKYREAWQAEMKISLANKIGWHTAQEQLRKARAAAQALLLTGTLGGLTLGLIIGAYLL